MANFTVTAFLRANVSDFQRGMAQAKTTIESLPKQVGSSMQKIGTTMQGIGKGMTVGMTVPLAAIGAASLKTFGDFQSQMNRVKAISGATGSQFEKLKTQAMDLGASSVFSATEVAKGQEMMASAGFKTNDIYKAMPGVMDLAAVSGGDLALASEAAATAVNMFGLKAGQAGHVADVFAQAAADTNAEVGDMAEALKYAGPVAGALGISLEETAAAVGIMSNAGIKGSQAGTTLRTAMTRLTDPTKKMQGVMQDLGLEFFDSNGKMKSLSGITQELQTKMAGLTDKQKAAALSTLFGKESLSGMLALVDSAPGSLDKQTQALIKSDGAAKQMADTMNSGVKGSIEELKGALETAGITIGEILAPAFEKVVNGLTELINWFNQLNPSTQTVIVAIAGVVAAIGPLLVIIGTAAVTFAKFKAQTGILYGAFTVLKGAVTALGAVFGFLATPIGLAIAAIAAVVAVIIYLWNTNEGFRSAVIVAWEAIKQAFSSAWEFLKSLWSGASEWFAQIWTQIVSFAQAAWTNFLAFIAPIVEQFKTLWGTIKEFFATMWQTVVSTATEIWNSFVTNITAIVEAIKALWQPLQAFFATLWQGILMIVNDVVNAIKDTWALLAPFVQLIWQQIATTVQTIITVIVTIVQTQLAILQSIWQAAWEIIKTVITTVWTIITTLVTNAINFIKNIIIAVTAALQGDWTTVWNSIKTILSTVWQGMQTIVTTIFNAIKNNITSVLNAIKSIITSVWNAIKSVITSAMNAIKSAVTSAWNSIRSAIQSAISSIGSVVSSGFNRVVSTVTSAGSRIVSAVRSAWNQAVNAARNFISQAVAIGGQIISGFVNGVKAAAGRLVSAVSGAVGNAINKAKSLLGIHSPSRVFRQFGIYTDQGFMIGINSKASKVAKTMGNMAQGAIDGFNKYDIAGSLENGIGDVQGKLNALTSTDPNLSFNGGSLAINQQPANINVNIGGQNFRAFTNNIMDDQAAEAMLGAY
ncbi:phage tail tape measure protein [Streptococcus pluranimalium]|uniref:phage tail tape measure protein n=1 Tax=Streptococcus pluranimalium TaxID=82348 RepID=UPI003F67B74F